MLSKEFRFAKPKKNVVVRYPRTYAILPETGGVVTWVGAEGRYWRRREKVGDIVIVEQQETIFEIQKQKIKKYSREEEGQE